MSEFSLNSLIKKIKVGENGRLVTFINPYTYLLARKRWDVFQQIDGICIDGVMLVAFFRLFFGLDVKRRSFDSTSMANEIFSACDQDGSSVYLIGATPVEISGAVSVIKYRYPRLKLCGFRSGFFDSADERIATIDEIATSQPDIVICGMGGGVQEAFLVDLKQAGWSGAGYTCGGYLHQLSYGSYDYYPAWVDRLNLRWAYRMVNEPHTVLRYLIDYPTFIVKFVNDYIKWR